MSAYLAHISKDHREQTVLAHLEGTAELCAAFGAEFGAGEQGRLAGLAHDLGKYSNAFQRRLLEQGPRVDHATAGAFECRKAGQLFAAFAVAGHHGGLPDGGTRGDSPDAGTFWGRMKKGEQGRLEDCSAWKGELSLPGALLPGNPLPGRERVPLPQFRPGTSPRRVMGWISIMCITLMQADSMGIMIRFLTIRPGSSTRKPLLYMIARFSVPRPI